MNTLRIGVLGCANIAMRSMIPAIKTIPDFKLVAIASRTKPKAQEFAQKFSCEAIEGYQNLLNREDIDAIYMPLPTGLHEEWVKKTLHANKHILIEKSLAMNFKSACELVDLASQKKLIIMENFMFLYHEQHKFVQNLMDENIIGEIRCFRSSFGFPPLDATNFRYNIKLGGGALLDAAAYTIRASQLFLGNDLSVEAATLNFKNSEVDLYGGAYLKTNNGLFSEVAFGFDNFYQCNYEIWGSTGKITAHRAFTPGPTIKPVISIETHEGITNHELAADNHFVNILKEFTRCVFENDTSTKYREILNQSRLLQELKDISSSHTAN